MRWQRQGAHHLLPFWMVSCKLRAASTFQADFPVSTLPELLESGVPAAGPAFGGQRDWLFWVNTDAHFVPVGFPGNGWISFDHGDSRVAGVRPPGLWQGGV